MVTEFDLREMLEGAGDAAFAVDQRGTILSWTAGAERLTGCFASDTLRQQCSNVLDGCGASGAQLCSLDCKVLKNSRCGQRTPAFNARIRTATGSRKWVNISILPARVQGKPVIVHLLRDVDAETLVLSLTQEIAILVGRLTDRLPEPLSERVRTEDAGVQLTSQESTILRLLSQGTSTAAIGSKLNVAPVTVRNHVQHILAKLGVHTRLEAVARASGSGLL